MPAWLYTVEAAYVDLVRGVFVSYYFVFDALFLNKYQ